jgi:hypothetical protein
MLAKAGIYQITVMPAVVELAPVAIGRGGYPSSGLDSRLRGNDGKRSGHDGKREAGMTEKEKRE